MKKLKSLLSSLCLVAALTLTVAPAKTVYAESGPQGGSNSTTSSPQPEMSYEELLWIIIFWLLCW
jgi:hypothetical protein